ncbi:MAG: dUTP diphosphatase [Chlorobi bacterium]|nr:dUTP diphosphatase [Chlorobiota bacterium]
MIEVSVVNKSKNNLPEYETEHAAGLDLRADVTKQISILPGERKLIGTGLYIELPVGYEAQIRPRSGLALKKGVTILNSPGTIDADYRGEVGIILINHSDKTVIIEPGERICQMVVKKYEQIKWKPVEFIQQSRRGEGGFGHTGNK